MGADAARADELGALLEQLRPEAEPPVRRALTAELWRFLAAGRARLGRCRRRAVAHPREPARARVVVVLFLAVAPRAVGGGGGASDGGGSPRCAIASMSARSAKSSEREIVNKPRAAPALTSG